MSPHPVLIADDSKVIRLLVKRAIEHLNVQTFEAENGHKALKLARLHRPELILLDIHMLGMDGVQALSRLRRDPDPAVRSIPVIMMTVENDPDTVMEILRLGVEAYLIKPFDIHRLVERVERVLHRSELPPQPPQTADAH